MNGTTSIYVHTVNHSVNGKECECGEPVLDCFWHALAVPAHRKAMESIYSEIFECPVEEVVGEGK